jgi:uncharacterized integral membrane protein
MNRRIDGHGGDKAEHRMALNIKIILLVLLGGAIALFLIQNVADVEIQFLFWSVTMRRATLVLLVLGVGVVIGWVLHGIHARTHRRRAASRILEQGATDSGGAVAETEKFDPDQ